ncbi:MAG: hypothetical protein SFZ24_06060 [Planctomycetota bacterium]|nr:hypothetical protein [Planctomycetota bacterium]
MNVSRFLEHWGITENPFKAEEARLDSVFARLGDFDTAHPDFEKFVGDFSRPATSIVFGEKGSGKTAMRLQLAGRVAAHNAASPDSKVLLVPYDDLGPLLDRFVSRVRSADDEDSPRGVTGKLKQLRLSDHLDGILHSAVVRVVDELIGAPGVPPSDAAVRAMRRAPARLRSDLLLLQALYDRQEELEPRARELRRRIRGPLNTHRLLWKSLAVWGWIPAAAFAVATFVVPRDLVPTLWLLWGMYAALAVWALLLINWFFVQRLLVIRGRARRVSKRLRVLGSRPDEIARIFELLPPHARPAAAMPADETEERRYTLLARLRAAIRPMGYTGLLVVVDRVDEPALVSGDPDRMRAVLWPMLSNSFLQQEGVGVKLLLPVELRHELFRESATFFQEARLDKQNFVERLTWTGATLYDLCNARLRACHRPAADAPQTISLVDLFAEDVTRQDIVDALDQMRQPRDAFKLLYACIQEHCSNVTEDAAQWRIPRLILETVRKLNTERAQMVQRGYRPA